MPSVPVGPGLDRRERSEVRSRNSIPEPGERSDDCPLSGSFESDGDPSAPDGPDPSRRRYAIRIGMAAPSIRIITSRPAYSSTTASRMDQSTIRVVKNILPRTSGLY